MISAEAFAVTGTNSGAVGIRTSNRRTVLTFLGGTRFAASNGRNPHNYLFREGMFFELCN